MKHYLTILLLLSFNTFSCNKTPYNFTTEQIEAALVKSELTTVLGNKNLLVTSLHGKYHATDFVNRFLYFSRLIESVGAIEKVNVDYEEALYRRTPVFLKELLKPTKSWCCLLSPKRKFYYTVSKELNKRLEASYARKLDYVFYVNQLLLMNIDRQARKLEGEL